jgi:hypothetical protein
VIYTQIRLNLFRFIRYLDRIYFPSNGIVEAFFFASFPLSWSLPLSLEGALVGESPFVGGDFKGAFVGGALFGALVGGTSVGDLVGGALVGAFVAEAWEGAFVGSGTGRGDGSGLGSAVGSGLGSFVGKLNA